MVFDVLLSFNLSNFFRLIVIIVLSIFVRGATYKLQFFISPVVVFSFLDFTAMLALIGSLSFCSYILPPWFRSMAYTSSRVASIGLTRKLTTMILYASPKTVRIQIIRSSFKIGFLVIASSMLRILIF